MDEKLKNPFTPVVGKVPAFMAGRDNIIADMEELFDEGPSSPSVISLLVGARGTGKTALLSYFAREAEGKGWVAAQVSCEKGILEEIYSHAIRSAEHLIDSAPKKKLKSVSITKIGALEWDNAQEEPRSWRTKMENILDALADTDTGLLITVDEVNSSIPEMTTLVSAFQHFIDEDRKVALLMAGLPYGLSTLLSGKTTSFLRRAARYNLGPISDYGVREALVVTMVKGGKTFKPEALDKAVEAINGFPYMLQLVGYRAWRISSDRTTINVQDIENAISIAQAELEERVYEATWFELTPADKEFLYALLEDDSVTLQSTLASRLGKTSAHVSRYKKRLLQEGVIQEKSRGVIEFCLPGFRNYAAQMKEDA